MQDQLFRESVTVTYTPGMCREPGCESPARRRQGARYCDAHARGTNGKSTGYNPLSGTEPAICVKCGVNYGRRTHRGVNQAPATRAWKMFCADCLRLSPLSLERLKVHGVPYEMALAWLMESDQLACQVCERKLRRKSQGTAPAIDHDHRCCDRERSCGQCIRGVLCTRCNTLIGGYERLALVVDQERLSAYLRF